MRFKEGDTVLCIKGAKTSRMELVEGHEYIVARATSDYVFLSTIFGTLDGPWLHGRFQLSPPAVPMSPTFTLEEIEKAQEEIGG